MELANLARATQLYQDLREIQRAVDVIDAGGTILAVTMSGPTGPAFIPTVGLTYPPQMMAAIKAQLDARRAAINQELTEMGVTPP